MGGHGTVYFLGRGEDEGFGKDEGITNRTTWEDRQGVPRGFRGADIHPYIQYAAAELNKEAYQTAGL